MAQNHPADAVEAGLEALALLDISLADGVSDAELAALPRDARAPMCSMQEPKMLAAMRILMSIGSPAFSAEPTLFPKISYTMVSLSARHGLCAESTHGLSLYGMMLCGSADDIESGYRFGRLATHLVEALGARELVSKIYLVYNVFIRH